MQLIPTNYPPRGCEAFLAIVTALGRPESDVDQLCNWFPTHMPIDDQPMKSLPPMVCVQCCLLGEYIHSHNMAPNNLMHAFSITGDEVEAWAHEHYQEIFLPILIYSTSSKYSPPLPLLIPLLQ